MNYEEGNNIHTEIEFFTHYFIFKKQQLILKLLNAS